MEMKNKYPTLTKILAANNTYEVKTPSGVLLLDIFEDVESSGMFGWEIINSEDGTVVDSKYGFSTWESAGKAGILELKKYKSSKG